MNKKGQTGTAGVYTLIGLGLALVVYGVVSSFGAEIVGDVRDDIGESACADRSDTFTSYNATSDQCYNSSGSHVAVGVAQFNVTTDSLEGISTASEKVPTIARVQVAAIIIGIIMIAFGGYMGIRTA